MKTFKAYFEAEEIRLFGSYLTKTIKADSIDEAEAKAEAISEILEDENGFCVNVLYVEPVNK